MVKKGCWLFVAALGLFSACQNKKDCVQTFPDGTPHRKYVTIGDKIEGEMLDYSREGKLLSRKFFKNDKQEGKTEYFFESGKLREVQYYQAGLRTQFDTVFLENGQISNIIQYDAGKINGSFISFDSSGTKIFHAIYKADQLEKVLTSLKDVQNQRK